MNSKIKTLCFSLVAICLLSACITTIKGPQKTVDPVKQLEVLVDLGTGYIRNRQYGRAKENLSKALELDPNSVTALNAFGLVYQLEGEGDLAETYFKRAIAVDGSNAMVRNNYGAYLYQRERFDEAVENLKIAVDDRLYNRRPQAFLNLGVSYLKLDNKVDAEQALMRSVQLDPRRPRALLELADLKFQQRNYVDARRYFTQFETMGQSSSRGLWLCVQLSRIFKNDDKAASCGLMLKNVFPNTYEYRRFEASLNK
ncbi:MAG: type IV pilus assembly protein PilF [Candidatus Azotimanducaceae bacterium]|jgi:type IV pilus assembly protein PilF